MRKGGREKRDRKTEKERRTPVVCHQVTFQLQREERTRGRVTFALFRSCLWRSVDCPCVPREHCTVVCSRRCEARE